MSASGVGRGRGWLNISNNSNNATSNHTQRPGSIPSPNPPALNPSVNCNDSESKEFVDAKSSAYEDLISKLSHINIADDGILFNQKIRYIIENWEKDCNTENEVLDSFNSIHDACLRDHELASKLVLLISSRTFLNQEIRSQNIRMLFLKKLQENFENSINLHKSNPLAFRNAVQMIGEFYNRARMSNGQPFSFMAIPLVSCLEILLDSHKAVDLELLTSQLCLNSCSLKIEAPEQFSNLLESLRMVLASTNNITKEAKLWLILSLELISSRSGISLETQSFFQRELGNSAATILQNKTSTLSVQTQYTSKTLDGYQSNVNVLQLSTPPDQSNEQQTSPLSNILSSNNQSANLSDSNSSHKSKTVKVENKSNTRSAGRPILGIGARLNKSRNTEVNNIKADRDITTTAWEMNKQKSRDNWDSKKPPKSTNKGWEHDDRFETDYS